MNIPDFVQPQYRHGIERLTEHFAADPAYLALLVGGSIAKGLARPDSDIDIVLIATDEEFQRRAQAGQYWYSSRDFTDYPGGYVPATPRRSGSRSSAGSWGTCGC